jgi:hypothetical protein
MNYPQTGRTFPGCNLQNVLTSYWRSKYSCTSWIFLSSIVSCLSHNYLRSHSFIQRISACEACNICDVYSASITCHSKYPISDAVFLFRLNRAVFWCFATRSNCSIPSLWFPQFNFSIVALRPMLFPSHGQVQRTVHRKHKPSRHYLRIGPGNNLLMRAFSLMSGSTILSVSWGSLSREIPSASLAISSCSNVLRCFVQFRNQTLINTQI